VIQARNMAAGGLQKAAQNPGGRHYNGRGGRHRPPGNLATLADHDLGPAWETRRQFRAQVRPRDRPSYHERACRADVDRVERLQLSGERRRPEAPVADLCALARPHLSDPFWTLRAAAGYGHAAQAWPPQYLTGRRQLERELERKAATT
jgi:hypothetical protein